jgi:tetratricopeptide (TPR) repeat protein
MGPLRLVSNRYALLDVAGRGGMSTVYRAVDQETKAQVAVKLLGVDGQSDAERFGREVRVHTDVVHPFVVRYLAHGTTEEGEPYLVMEWLEGETLAQRLSRGPLSLSETLAMALQVAVGLRSIHRRGVVHRDIKPSNLFLVSGRCDNARILDFGIARGGSATPITRTGGLLGSVGYIAPEQLEDPRKADARADIFSFGCVLYECLCGEAAYAGRQGFEVWSSMLRGEIRALSEHVDVPIEVGSLVERMLARDPGARPADGAQLATELEQMSEAVSVGPPLSSRLAQLSLVEHKLVALVALGISDAHRGDAHVAPWRADDETVVPIRAIAQGYGGRLFVRPGGTLVIAFGGERSPHERAGSAASCAVRLRRALRERCRCTIGMGPVGRSAAAPTGPVLDRCVALLNAAEAGGIVLDDGVVGFLGDSFEVAPCGTVRMLVGEAEPQDGQAGASAVVLVGRERELSLLDGTLTECIAEPVARAVVVTGEPGIGKSRLSREFRMRAEKEGRSRVAAARAQLLDASSALSLVRQLLTNDLASPRGVAAPLHVRLHEHLGLAECSWTCEFLCELLGEPVTAPGSAELRAARGDPRVMNEAIQRAFLAWAAIRCRQRALVVLLDDVQWVDRASLKLVEQLLARRGDDPLMVVALGRRDVSNSLSSLWEDYHPQHVRLTPLTRNVAARLVTNLMRVHGATIDPALVAFAVEKGSGNPLHLEELVRHAVRCGPASVPTAVLSMLVARLEQLEPEARRVLRAASLFGRVFDGESVGALAGIGAGPPTQLWLEQLLSQSLIEPQGESERGVVRYSFQHDLLRDAAYSLLTEHDRTNGHRLAGEWLEVRGGSPEVIAEHFLQSDSPVRAVGWLLRAAQKAMASGLLDSVLEIAERGLELPVAGEELAGLRAIRAEAFALRGEWPAACAEASLGFAAARQGTPDWWATAGLELFGGTGLTPMGRVFELVAALASVEKVEQPDARYARAMHCAIAGLVLSGQQASADLLIERVRSAASTLAGSDPNFEGWLCVSDVVCKVYRTDPDLAGTRAMAQRAIDLFSFGGDATGSAVALWYRAWANLELGLLYAAIEDARRAQDLAAAARSTFVAEWSRYMEASAMLFVDPDEGELQARALIDTTTDDVWRAFAQVRLALHFAEVGRIDEAEAHADAAMRTGCYVPIVEGAAATARALIALSRGNAKDALPLIKRAIEVADRGADPIWHSQAHLTLVLTLLACHLEQDASNALDRAAARIESLSTQFADTPEWRDAYRGSRVHTRTLDLARERAALNVATATSA